MKRKLLTSAVCLLITATVLVLQAAPAKAAFIANNLIDNPVFDNSGSMNASQIDAWLNANFPNSCLSTNNGFLSPHPNGYHPDTGFTYGAPVSAGRVIADSATAYDLNPQVLIATLEKESSVVTGNASYHCQYINTSMGFDCPDAGSCPQNPATESGFSKQVIHAAWILKFAQQRSQGNTAFNIQKPGWDNSDDPSTSYSGPMTQGNLSRGNGSPTTFYDGYTTIDGTAVHMDNGATASFYNYTPHFHGNQLFVSIFENWFGSTAGELVRTEGNAQVYIINTDTNKKYPINNGDVLNNYSTLGVRYVSDSYLAQYTTGQPVTNMAQGTDGTLYLVNAGIKLPFTSCSGDVVAYGFTCASNQYTPLTVGQTNKLVSGPGVTSLVRSNADPTIYYISDGQKRPVGSWHDATSYNISTSFNVLTSSFINSLPTGPALYGTGSLVKTASSSTIYAVKDMTHLMPISSFSYPQELGLSTSFRTMSDSDFQSVYNSASGASNLTNRVICNSNNYVGTNSSLFLVSGGMATNYGYSNGDFVDAGGICNDLQVNSQSLSQYIRTSDGTIYYVSGGQKRAFSSYSTFQSASYCNNACTVNQVSNSFAGSITSGANL